VTFVASRQATEALKALLGAFERIEPAMWVVDLWSNEMRRFDVRGAYEPGACVCCGERKFEYLEGRGASATTQLCGRDAVQVTPSDRPTASIDLDAIAARLGEHGEVRRTKFMVRVDLVDAGRPLRLTVFPDGRTIVHGTDEPSAARAVCARYLGM